MVVDRRYKVNQDMIDSMRVQRALGATYSQIAESHGVSYYTANYWTNDKTRAAGRLKNAKRRYAPGDKRRIQRDMNKRKENKSANKKTALRHNIQSAIGEKRLERKTVSGMKMKDAKKLIRSGSLNLKNNKMRD